MSLRSPYRAPLGMHGRRPAGAGVEAPAWGAGGRCPCLRTGGGLVATEVSQ